MLQIFRTKQWFGDLLLLLGGALLFSLSFPNFISPRGFSFLAWFALIPVFYLIHKRGFLKTAFYGALYGYFAYTLLNFWLAEFNPTSFVVVPMIYAVYFLFWFPLFKWADWAFPRGGYLIQSLFWLCFEIFRTRGFLGYSYGILGYSQYENLSLIGIADITGVLGVSFLVIFPGLWLQRYLRFHLEERGNARTFRKASFLIIPALLYLVLLFGSIAYSVFSRVDYKESPRWRASLIQHDINAWLSGTEVYEQALDKLLALSARAIEEEAPDVVVWSETAFVPSIQWHYKKRPDRKRLALVLKLLNFLEKQDLPFIIGNNDTVLEAGRQVTYNAVLHFKGQDIAGGYHKIHLVPFGEHFPYEKIFPRFYRYILSTGATFYEHGNEYTVFDLDGVKAGPLICFEDTFGYLSRNFVRAGAQVLVNVSNDSWSPSPACSMQHAGMAVFRSIENRRSMIRATNGGFTCLVDPNGKIQKSLKPFTADVLTVDVPVYSQGQTFYNKTDSLFDRGVVLLSALAALMLFFAAVGKYKKGRREKEYKERRYESHRIDFILSGTDKPGPP